jgi:metal-responsive CopG/Arc/MetJ family transcriptional regulator
MSSHKLKKERKELVKKAVSNTLKELKIEKPSKKTKKAVSKMVKSAAKDLKKAAQKVKKTKPKKKSKEMTAVQAVAS